MANHAPATRELKTPLATAQRSAGLGHLGPYLGVSKSGTRGEAALGPAPINEAQKLLGISLEGSVG